MVNTLIYTWFSYHGLCMHMIPKNNIESVFHLKCPIILPTHIILYHYIKNLGKPGPNWKKTGASVTKIFIHYCCEKFFYDHEARRRDKFKTFNNKIFVIRACFLVVCYDQVIPNCSKLT